MSALSKQVRVRFAKQPKGFVGAFRAALQKELDKRAPRKDGDLENSNRVTSLGGGLYRASNRRFYASYVDKTGPRAGGKPGSTKKFFTGVVNSRKANEIARKVRRSLGGK